MEYERRGGGYRGRGGGYGGRREGGRSFGGPRGFAPKPVEIGKEYDVEITEMSRRGEGIARIKGLVVFVPNAKTGDKVKIRVTRISRRFCEAEVVGEAAPKAEGETETEAETETETETATETATETEATEETETSEGEETDTETE
jgi:predicted RNA-binding protein with TRAM domain